MKNRPATRSVHRRVIVEIGKLQSELPGVLSVPSLVGRFALLGSTHLAEL